MVAAKSQSSLRAEHAAHTRSRILQAAADVFVELGYAGARIDDVAARAGVAVPTVYKVFTNKTNLLVGALNEAMTGGDDAGAIDQQSWFIHQLEEPDAVRQLKLVARNARRLYEQAGRLLNVLRAAAPLDAELDHAWGDIASERLKRSRRTANSLSRKAGARARLSRDDTAVTLLALTEPELFSAFAAGKRTADQYETWLGDVLCRSLLE
jgi:AcrR family transcriptional regulator